MSLKSRLAVRVLLTVPLVAALMFAPAGSFAFWQGWVFVGIFAASTVGFIFYFYRRDPKLIERRLENREPRREQKRFKMVWVPLWVVTLILPGFDYRFGWSVRLLGGVPPAVTGAAFAALCVAWLLVFYVMRINSFASAIVQVEAGQKVIAEGPYRVVRHPMYSGFALMILAAPPALGSYVAVLPAVMLIPVLAFRLQDEERLLREELAGYKEYCKRTKYRMVPYVF
jgi:protein-S-isoprenylcysteine O-methyltransferase Ste14